MSLRGRAMASKASFMDRRLGGTQITFKGAVYVGSVSVVPHREASDLAEGLGVNAANADFRRVLLSPRLFPRGGMPGEQDALSWDEGRGVTLYTVLRAPLTNFGGDVTQIECLVYRKPPPDAATEESAGDQTAGVPVPAGAVGLRKSY